MAAARLDRRGTADHLLDAELVFDRLGNRSLLRYTAAGDWRPVLALSVGCWICAFFWEMWNYGSYPKWVYRLPFANFLHIFEMPLLGYAGYVPFAWELFAIYSFILGLLGEAGKIGVVRVCEDDFATNDQTLANLPGQKQDAARQVAQG